MVVGGYFYDGVEVISPDGNCSLSLAQFPYGTIHLGAGAAMAPGMSSPLTVTPSGQEKSVTVNKCHFNHILCSI